MHARSTTIHGDPRSVEAATAYVRDEVMPMVRGMDGCLGLSMLADHDTRRCIITTSWRDEAAMRAPEAGRRSVGEYAEDYLAGATSGMPRELCTLRCGDTTSPRPGGEFLSTR